MAENKHPNREGLSAAGFTVADGRYKALPSDFCVVGGSGPNDMTADALTRLYPADTANHKRARAIILGARDRLRVAKPPPPEFIDACRNGIVQDIGTADLREDKNGRRWVVVLVGRQRVQARRIIDADGAKKKPPEPALSMFCVMSAFASKKDLDGNDFDAELAALEANCRSNCFVAEPPSVLADKARMLSDKGMADRDIAVRIGASGGAEHVALLVALSRCEPCVWAAVDANKMALSLAPKYAAAKPDEQERRVARLLAGNGRAGKDAAAPPRAKTRPAPVLASVEAMARRMTSDLPADAAPDSPGVRILMAADIVRWARGGEPPAWWVKVIEADEAERKAGGK